MEVHEVPGYREAFAQVLAETESLRELAFTDLPVKILDLDVSQLTLRKFFLLAATENPLLFGGRVEPEHVVQFLWIVSLDFDPKDSEKRDIFVQLVARMPFTETVSAIRKYCDDALMDRPPCKLNAEKSDSPTCYMAYFEHKFSSAYGWDLEKILDKPMARLYQLIRQMQLEQNPKIALLNTRLAKLEDEYAMKAWEMEQQKAQL